MLIVAPEGDLKKRYFDKAHLSAIQVRQWEIFRGSR
jgi:hypothetical protein